MFSSFCNAWRTLASESKILFFSSLSCVVAVGVNVFTCFLLGKTSAVTYQVVGHIKTIIILSGGYFFFDHESSAKVAIGGVVALGTFSSCLIQGVCSHYFRLTQWDASAMAY